MPVVRLRNPIAEPRRCSSRAAAGTGPIQEREYLGGALAQGRPSSRISASPAGTPLRAHDALSRSALVLAETDETS
jgi:hypothetical protein